MKDLDLNVPKPGAIKEQAQFQQQIADDIQEEDNEIDNNIEAVEEKEIEVQSDLDKNKK